MESMEDRIATLEAQLLAHQMLLSMIAADMPPSLRRQLAAAAGAAETVGLATTLSDAMLAVVRSELMACVPPSAAQS